MFIPLNTVFYKFLGTTKITLQALCKEQENQNWSVLLF